MANEYRKGAGQVARDTRWTVFRFLPIFIIVVVLLGGLGFFLRSGGVIGRTVVDRVVFEKSYQRSEAFKAKIAMDEASIAQIQGQLLNPNLDENTRFNLNAQVSAARIRINTARSMQ